MNYKQITFTLLLTGAASFNAHAADKWLISSQSEAVNTGQKIKLEVVKPEGTAVWPETLTVKLSSNGVTEDIPLSQAKAQGNIHRLYTGVPTKKYVGIIRAELTGQPSNRLVMLASNEETGPVQVVGIESAGDTDKASVRDAATTDDWKSPPVVVIAKPGDEPSLSANEPTYFVVGSSDDRGADSRFQISFKYRPFDPKGSVAEFLPLLSNVYFTYTQTTLWDLGENSSPFRDTSYRPGVFYRWTGRDRSIFPAEWRAGLEHESNGQGGIDSRSINTAYVRPTWNFDLPNGRRLSFLPKIYGYIEKDQNSDIDRYRGYADWQLRYGREDGLIVGALYRQGTAGYATGQVDLSYPLSDRIFAGTGTFLHVQMFSGYGETLLEYNQHRDTQIRIGLSVTR